MFRSVKCTICEFLSDVGLLGAIFACVFIAPFVVVLFPFWFIGSLLSEFNEFSKTWFDSSEKKKP